jgi:hypothetical protein
MHVHRCYVLDNIVSSYLTEYNRFCFERLQVFIIFIGLTEAVFILWVLDSLAVRDVSVFVDTAKLT